MVEGRIVEMEAGLMVLFLEASALAGKNDNQRRDGGGYRTMSTDGTWMWGFGKLFEVVRARVQCKR